MTTRLDELVLAPLAVLHDAGWGPEEVEVDPDAGEVRFVFTRAIASEGDGE